MEMPEIKTTVNKLGHGLYAIDQVMVRSFLIVGKSSALLLDTGAMDIDLPAMVKEITALPVTLCMTHSDGDHTAALGRFESAYVHPKEMELLKSKQPEITTKLIPVEEGHIFDLGDRSLKVIFTPGHTPGSVCLLDEGNSVLFSGDTVSYGPVFMFGGHRDMASFMATLEKLNSLAAAGEFKTIYPCHNTCPVDVSCISELIACAQGIQDGTLSGKEPNMPLPGTEKPLEYTVGKSGIYH